MSKLSLSRENWSMWWLNRLFYILCSALVLSACGYQYSGLAPINLPEDSTKIFLNKVTDPTTETWIEPMLRSSIRDEFTRRGKVTWVGRDEAQATMNIVVHSYSTSDSLKGRHDVTLKSEARIQLEVSIYNALTHSLIWTSGTVVASESYRGSGGTRTSEGIIQETSAKREATRSAIDLAARIVADRLSQKF